MPTLFIIRFSASPQHLANDEPKLWRDLSFYKIKPSNQQRIFLSSSVDLTIHFCFLSVPMCGFSEICSLFYTIQRTFLKLKNDNRQAKHLLPLFSEEKEFFSQLIQSISFINLRKWINLFLKSFFLIGVRYILQNLLSVLFLLLQ